MGNYHAGGDPVGGGDRAISCGMRTNPAGQSGRVREVAKIGAVRCHGERLTTKASLAHCCAMAERRSCSLRWGVSAASGRPRRLPRWQKCSTPRWHRISMPGRWNGQQAFRVSIPNILMAETIQTAGVPSETDQTQSEMGRRLPSCRRRPRAWASSSTRTWRGRIPTPAPHCICRCRKRPAIICGNRFEVGPQRRVLTPHVLRLQCARRTNRCAPVYLATIFRKKRLFAVTILA